MPRRAFRRPRRRNRGRGRPARPRQGRRVASRDRRARRERERALTRPFSRRCSLTSRPSGPRGLPRTHPRPLRGAIRDVAPDVFDKTRVGMNADALTVLVGEHDCGMPSRLRRAMSRSWVHQRAVARRRPGRSTRLALGALPEQGLGEKAPLLSFEQRLEVLAGERDLRTVSAESGRRSGFRPWRRGLGLARGRGAALRRTVPAR